jgi:hypothetical protein
MSRDGQVGNHLEVAQIPHAERVAEVEGSRADQQIHKRNRAAQFPRLGVDPGCTLGHLPGERFHRDRRENGIQVFAPLPRLLSGMGAMQAVLQFDHRDGRQHDLGFAVLVFECGQQFAYRLGVTLSPKFQSSNCKLLIPQARYMTTVGM